MRCPDMHDQGELEHEELLYGYVQCSMARREVVDSMVGHGLLHRVRGSICLAHDLPLGLRDRTLLGRLLHGWRDHLGRRICCDEYPA